MIGNLTPSLWNNMSFESIIRKGGDNKPSVESPISKSVENSNPDPTLQLTQRKEGNYQLQPSNPQKSQAVVNNQAGLASTITGKASELLGKSISSWKHLLGIDSGSSKPLGFGNNPKDVGMGMQLPDDVKNKLFPNGVPDKAAIESFNNDMLARSKEHRQSFQNAVNGNDVGMGAPLSVPVLQHKVN